MDGDPSRIYSRHTRGSQHHMALVAMFHHMTEKGRLACSCLAITKNNILATIPYHISEYFLFIIEFQSVERMTL